MEALEDQQKVTHLAGRLQIEGTLLAVAAGMEGNQSAGVGDD